MQETPGDHPPDHYRIPSSRTNPKPPLARKTSLLRVPTAANAPIRNRARCRKSEAKEVSRPMLDLLFLLSILAVVICVYQFCPGQHMF
jgi:hypothetical protein